MADETLRFRITGSDDGASSAFRRVGDSASAAARGARANQQAMDQQRQSMDAAARSAAGLSRSDQTLSDAERKLRDDADRTAEALRRQADEARRAADVQRRAAASLLSGLGGGQLSGKDRDLLSRFLSGGSYNRSELERLLRSGGSGSGGGGGGGGFLSNLAGGVGPGILGINGMLATKIGLGGVAGGLLPSLGSILGVGAFGGAGLGAAQLGLSSINQTIGPLVQQEQAIQNQLMYATGSQRKMLLAQQRQIEQSVKGLSPAFQSIYKSESYIQNEFQTIGQKIAPAFAGPLKAVAGEFKALSPLIIRLFQASAPLITQFAKGIGDVARMVLPLLIQGIRAATPFLRPLIDGFGKLAAGLFKGLIPITRAAGPAIKALSSGLAALGKGLGGMFRDMAPAVKASSVLLKDVLDVVGSLFPVIGKLAAILAKALAPVFTTFAKVIKALEPALIQIGKIVAGLAGAVLGDLVSVFLAVANVMKSVAPGLATLAKAFSAVFNTLENSGAFAVLGDALEQIAPLLGKLVSTLLVGLAKILPPVIKLVAALAKDAIKILGGALGGVLPILIQFTQTFLKALVPILPPIAKALIQVGDALTKAFLAGLKSEMPVLAEFVRQLGKLLQAIAPILPPLIKLAGDLITLLLKAVTPMMPTLVRLSSVMIQVAKAIVGLIQPILQVIAKVLDWATKMQNFRDLWHTIWTDIQNIFGGIVGWVERTFDSWLQHVSANIDTLKRFFDEGWQHIKDTVNTVGDWLWNTFGSKLADFFTRTIPNAFRTAVSLVGRIWSDIKGAVAGPVNWVIANVLNKLISAFDWISSKVGGPHINPIPGISAGGAGQSLGHAKGGLIKGGLAGRDSVLGMLMPGEVVVPTGLVNAGAVDHLRGRLPGFAAGGKVGTVGQNAPGHNNNSGGGGLFGLFGGLWNKIWSAITASSSAALTALLTKMTGSGTGGAVGDMTGLLADLPKALIVDAVKKLIGLGGGGSSNDIVSYALSFLGKIPYVLGGTSLTGGADCSGFVQAIYQHFGISAPRTSEEQGAWVRKGPPVPGGLAFYVSPAGGPPPGHVAIVRNASQVISQGGGMGPQLMALRGMPLMFTGTPPGGFGGGASTNGPGGGSPAANERLARRIFPWASYQWPAFNSVEMREAGYRLTAQNPRSPAYGMAQFIGGPSEYFQYGGNPNTALGQLTAMFNYIRQRYGLPTAAWQHELQYGSYDRGGFLKPGLTLAYNGTGRPEPVGSAAGGNVYNITVQVGPGTAPVAVARQLADILNHGAKAGVRLRKSILATSG